MTSYTRWQDIRAGHVARAGGEEAVQAGKEELLAESMRAREALAPARERSRRPSPSDEPRR
ncbi:hypothetical protein ABZ853_18755 [Streptomyces albidoflavus]